MKTAALHGVLAIVLSAGDAHAAQCVDAKSAKEGLVLERPGIHSEFRPAAGGMISVANKYESQSPQTQFLFGGLIEVFRDSKTGQMAMIPLSDMRKLFPLQTGAKSKTLFVRLASNKQPKGTETVAIAVQGKETFRLGDCKYNVLNVKQTITNEAGETLDEYTALYAPDLQAVLAKRYDQGTRAESVVGYETIKALTE